MIGTWQDSPERQTTVPLSAWPAIACAMRWNPLGSHHVTLASKHRMYQTSQSLAQALPT